MDEWDKVYSKWKSIEDEKAEKIKNRKEEKKKAEVFSIAYFLFFIFFNTSLQRWLKQVSNQGSARILRRW